MDNNVVLIAAEVQMSKSRETQPAPTNPQEETQISKCVIDRLVSVVLPTLSMAVSYQTRH